MKPRPFFAAIAGVALLYPLSSHAEAPPPAPVSPPKYWPFEAPWQKVNGLGVNIMLVPKDETNELLLSIYLGETPRLYKDVGVQAFDSSGNAIAVSQYDPKEPEYGGAPGGVRGPTVALGDYILTLKKGQTAQRIEITLQGQKATFSDVKFTSTTDAPDRAAPPPIPTTPPKAPR